MELRVAVEYLQKAKRLAEELQNIAGFYDGAAEKVRECQQGILEFSMPFFIKIDETANEVFRCVRLVAEAHKKPMPKWNNHQEFVRAVDDLSKELTENSLEKCRAWYSAMARHLARGHFVNKTTGKPMTAYERLRKDAITELASVSDANCKPVEGPGDPDDWLVWIWSNPAKLEKRLEPFASWAVNLQEMLAGTDRSQWVLIKSGPATDVEIPKVEGDRPTEKPEEAASEPDPSIPEDPSPEKPFQATVEVAPAPGTPAEAAMEEAARSPEDPGGSEEEATVPDPEPSPVRVARNPDKIAPPPANPSKPVTRLDPPKKDLRSRLKGLFNPWAGIRDETKNQTAVHPVESTVIAKDEWAAGPVEGSEPGPGKPGETPDPISNGSNACQGNPEIGVYGGITRELSDRSQVKQRLGEVARNGEYLRAALLAGALELEGVEKADPRFDGLITAHQVATQERCQEWPLWCYNPVESASMAEEFPETAKLVLVASLCQARNEHGLSPLQDATSKSLLEAFNLQPDIRSFLDEYIGIAAVPGLWEQVCRHSSTDPLRDYREARSRFQTLYDNSLRHKTSNVAYNHRMEHFIARQPGTSKLSGLLKPEKPMKASRVDEEAIRSFLARKPEDIFEDWLATTRGATSTVNLKGNQKHEIVKTADHCLNVCRAAWNAATNLLSVRAPSQDVEQRAKALKAKAGIALGSARSAPFRPLLDKLLEGFNQ